MGFLVRARVLRCAESATNQPLPLPSALLPSPALPCPSQVFGRFHEATARSAADRIALLSFAVINMIMMAVTKTLDLFGRERPIVTRERVRRQYLGVDYVLTKLLAELPLDASFSAVFAWLLHWRTYTPDDQGLQL